MKFTPNLVIGVVITLVGIVLMLDRLGLVEMGQALKLWPILIAVFGLSVIAQALQSDKEGRPVGGRPIVSPGFVLFLAVVSVLAWRTEGRSFMRRGDPVAAEQTLVGIMGRDDRVVSSQAFGGAEMTSVMGRTRLDLRQATLQPDADVVVDVFGLMGAVEIVVPAHWTIDSQAWAVMGGINDRRRRTSSSNNDSNREDSTSSASASNEAAPVEADQTAAPGASPAVTGTPPRLIIRGVVVMGALVIRS